MSNSRLATHSAHGSSRRLPCSQRQWTNAESIRVMLPTPVTNSSPLRSRRSNTATQRRYRAAVQTAWSDGRSASPRSSTRRAVPPRIRSLPHPAQTRRAGAKRSSATSSFWLDCASVTSSPSRRETSRGCTPSARRRSGRCSSSAGGDDCAHRTCART